MTPAGYVYPSQQFAALAPSLRVRDYTCEYMGQIPQPKHSAIIPLYLVRRSTLRELNRPDIEWTPPYNHRVSR